MNMMHHTIKQSKQKVAQEMQAKTSNLYKYFVLPSVTRKSKGKPKSRNIQNKKKKKQHQTYISFQFNAHRLQYHRQLPMQLKKISPKLLQSEIPWAHHTLLKNTINK